MKVNESYSTDRVKLRKMTPGDLDDLATLYQTEQVAEALGGQRPREQVLEGLERHIKHWDQHGFGYFIFEDNQTGSFMGRGGLLWTDADGERVVEVGYALMPEYWNKGLATEIVAELIRIAFSELDQDEVVGFTLPNNEASKKVLTKNGFVYEKEFVYKGLPHVMYRLKAQDSEKAE